MIGEKICGLYEGSGWSTGTVTYYNSKLDKYQLMFEDGSTSLIKEDDIDGVEMFFADKEKVPRMVARRSKRVD